MDTITVDKREPENMKRFVIQKCKETNVEYKCKRLDCGDYVFDNELVFERKTIQDFWGSFVDKRLFHQTVKMYETAKHYAIILEGSYLPVRLRKRRLLLNHIRNSLSWVVPIIVTEGKQDTVNEMFRFYDKYRKQELNFIRLKPEIQGQIDEVEAFLCGIPNVSVETAKVLRKNMQDITDLVINSILIKDLKVGGKRIGKRAEKITEFLNKKWE